MTSKLARWLLAGAFGASTLFDLVTFLLLKDFTAFEANPIYLATHSIPLMIALKVVVSALIITWVFQGWPLKKSPRWHMFAVTQITLLATFGQVLGGWSNLRILATHPAVTEALPAQVARAAYIQLSFWLILLPYALSILTFWLWDWAYHDCRETQDETIAAWIRNERRGDLNGQESK